MKKFEINHVPHENLLNHDLYDMNKTINKSIDNAVFVVLGIIEDYLSENTKKDTLEFLRGLINTHKEVSNVK